MLINGVPGRFTDANDRGLLYGDGVFETVLIKNGQLTLWDLHLQRLVRSCKLLALPLDQLALQRDIDSVLQSNTANGVLKVIITRGTGGRGYRPVATGQTRIVQFHQLPQDYTPGKPDGVRVKLCGHPLSRNSRLSGVKHLGRLDQVLASTELSENFDEGIMSTDSGQIIEGTKSNLFVVIANQLVTPGLESAGVAGVMREFLITRFTESGQPVKIVELALNDLLNATEIFLCNSVFGVWPVVELVHPQGTLNLATGPYSKLAIGFQEDEFSRYS